MHPLRGLIAKGLHQVLHDEIQNLSLELNQVIVRNEALKADNASLLQRWVDHQNEAAARMNSANSFYEDMRRKGWKDGKDDPASTDASSTTGSGNESTTSADEDPFFNLQDHPPQKSNGPRLNPNG